MEHTLIELPAPASVFTLRGATKNEHMAGWLRGVFDRPPYTVTRIDYPANMQADSIQVGVQRIDQFVDSTPGQKIGVGQSQGAQACTEWIYAHNDDPNAPGPDELMFVLTGNPVRNPTGHLVGNPTVGPLGSKGRPTPLDSRWRVIDVARVGDPYAIATGAPWWQFWADWWGKIFIHGNYYGVDLFDPGNVVVQRGNITLVTTA